MSDVPRVRVSAVDELPAALTGAGLGGGTPVVVLVGGAAGMSDGAAEAVATVLRETVVPAVRRHGAVLVDGGTDSGVMRLVGRERAAADGFPLVGVAVEDMVVVPGGEPPVPDAAALEPHHSLFVLVPGTGWGAEAPWIGEVATVLAAGRPSVTVLLNGGGIAYTDVRCSLDAGRPVVVLSGTGRTADAIVQARVTGGGDPPAVEAAASPLTVVVDVGSPAAVAAALDRALAEPGQN